MSPRASSEEIKKPAGPVLRILTCTCPLSGLTLFTHFLTITRDNSGLGHLGHSVSSLVRDLDVLFILLIYIIYILYI